MPNFKIPHGILGEIRENAISLACRPVRSYRMRFPLSNDEVQEMVMAPEPLRMCRALKDISGLCKNSNTVIRINKTPATPTRVALERDIALDVQNIDIYYVQQLRYFSRIRAHDIINAERNTYVLALTEHLRDERWDQLIKWANAMNMMVRREQLTIWFIDEMLSDLTDTTTLHQLWPLLATFTRDDRWRHRINSAAMRNAGRYAPNSTKMALVARYKLAVEEILADCSLTDPSPGIHGKKYADMPAWERLEGEWKPGAP